MKKQFNVAIVGATGAVGETMLSILDERDFPIGSLALLASKRSAGKLVDFQGESHEIVDLAEFDFSNTDIALFSAGGSVSEKYAPIAAEQGCVVIDNTSCFRYVDEIPLVVSEVNPHAIENYKVRGIIANPNCSTMQMMVALKPLQDKYGIERITVSTYQAVSGSGQKAVDELLHQTKEFLNGRQPTPEVYPQTIAFNLIPHIDVFYENGYTKEEMKMVWETHKIFEDDAIQVNPTAVRVPVLYGHSEAIHVKLKCPVDADEVRQELRVVDGLEVFDNIEELQYPTPFKQAAGRDPVYVGRIRNDLDDPTGLNMWVVADNVRKGAALNAVQIAEILIEKYLN